MTELTAGDRAAITAAVRRSAGYADPPMPEEQTAAAVALALDLYAAASAHGIERADADSVTSFPSAALDGIRWRDRAAARHRPAQSSAGSALCGLCGLPADALVHHATANGHAYA